MKLEIAFKWLREIQWILGSDVLNTCHCACSCSGILVLFVGGLGCVLSLGIAFEVVEYAASGKGRVGGTTEY